MPTPLILPYASPEPWKRRLHDVVSQMPVMAALAIGSVLLVAAAWADWIFDRHIQHNVSETAIYLVPVGFVAWSCGLRLGVVMATVAALVESLISATSIANHNVGVVGVVFAFEYATYLLATVVLARLRYLLEEERTLARTDSLTGVANIRSFWHSMELEVARMRRDSRPLSVIFVDIDDFKSVNDTSGHDAGDQLLRTLAEVMTGVTREVDSVARVGGDEFAVLLPGADSAAGLSIIRRLQASLRARYVDLGTEAPTLSIGLATFSTPPDTSEALLRAADILMYEAKTGGKNRIATRCY